MGGFVGRKEELSYLETVYSKCPVACAVCGRRHQGKTALVKEFCREKAHIYLSATRGLKEDDLGRMAHALSEFSGKKVVLNDIEDLFPMIKRVCGRKQVVVILNNFSDLVDSFPEVTSYLRMFMSREINTTKIMLLVCDTDSSIFGRFYYNLDVKSMSYRDCIGFHPDYTPLEHLTAYSIVGGSPAYQRMFSGNPAQAIQDQFFHHLSPFYLEVEGMIGSETEMRFVSTRVLAAMAAGAENIRDISIRTGLSQSLCAKAVEDMDHKGMLMREVSSGPSKRTVYSINSNLLRFYCEVIHKCAYQMEFGSREEAFQRAMPEIKVFIEKSFKGVCMDYVSLNYKYGYVGRVRKRDDTADSMIDFVAAVTEDGVECTAVATCRLFGAPFDNADLERLKLRAKSVPGSNRIYMMFSGCGFAPDLQRQAEIARSVRLTSLEDVYKV